MLVSIKNTRKLAFVGLDKPRMLFSPLINVKMPRIVGILTFMSRKNFMLIYVEHEKKIITSVMVVFLPKSLQRVLPPSGTLLTWETRYSLSASEGYACSLEISCLLEFPQIALVEVSVSFYMALKMLFDNRQINLKFVIVVLIRYRFESVC